jgi:iron-sulfur cluster assembly accessory protein
MVTITQRAAARALELMAAENDPGLTSLRVAVEGGGCSGFQYALGFDGDPEPEDSVAELHGLRLVVDPHSLVLLDGADVDYVDGLQGAGFHIANPNVASACGCGTSFQPRESEDATSAHGDDCGCGA